MAKPDDTPSMALFCDFENVALGVRDAKYEKFDIRRVLERLLLKGSIVVKKAYCDWARYREFKAEMHEASFELIEIPHVRQSGKNSADIRMVVDALDLCYTKSHVDTFVIISGDSDFSPLVSKLRENAKTVIGVGVKGSTSDLLTANCDEFIFYDDLVREHRRRGAQGAARRETPREPARDAGRDSGREGSRDGNREGGRDAGRGGRGNGAGRGPDRDAPREPLRVVPASARAEPGDEASSVVGGPWRRHAPEPREPAIADARDPVPDAGSAFDATATFTAADFAAEDLAAARGATGGNADDALDAARDDALDAARDDARDDDAPDDAARDDADAVEPAAAADDEARAPARRPRRSRARAAAVDGATDASVAAAAPGPDEA
ncbi:MAG TPA: NYN domain-containing protein, partial [Burkholderiaceae bacterium]|nr:NYN domain-containing protein [Burkholderiaceae bacterium]